MLPAGIPVSAAAVYRYQSSTSNGAILMTSPPVVRQRYFYESPFRQWVQDNALRILEQRPEVRDHGLWIVTSTYGTKNCSLNVWSGRQKEVMLGFSAKDVSGGEVGPAAQWYEAASDSDWSRYSATGDALRIVFIGGLRFRYTRLSKKEVSVPCR
jgi:hypothetical protein